MIKQFLTEVDWGQLDFLLIDTPPGINSHYLLSVSNIIGLHNNIILYVDEKIKAAKLVLIY